MKRFVIFMTIVTFLLVTMMTVQAQMQKPTQPIYKTLPKVEKPAVSPTGIQWSTPSKPYFGVTDSVPSSIVKVTEFQVELTPGKSFEFEVPLWKAGTMISIRAVPEGAKPALRKAQATISSTRIDEALQPLLEEQKREEQIKVLSVSITVGKQVFNPIIDLSGRYKFLFIVGSQFSGYGKGKATIKNISNQIFRGKVYASSTDHAGKESFERQKQQAAIQSAIDTARNPDMLWLFSQTLKRHLSGYLGGKSDYEVAFYNRLSRSQVRNETLRIISSHLAANENRIAQRVVNKSILQIRGTQPIKMEMIRPILKMERVTPKPEFQVAPKPEFKVAEPKVKPGELAASQSKITVLYPNGGEVWEEGKTYTIRWSSEGVRGNVRIQLWWSMTGPEGLHTIDNIPNTGSYSFTVPHLSTQAEITPILIISSMDDWNIRDDSDKSFTIKMKRAEEVRREKYTMKIIGVASHRCADDEGWDWDPDNCEGEQPYIFWIAFGPGYEAIGRTEQGDDVSRGEFYIYTLHTRTYGGGNNRTQAIPVDPPLVISYMVCDKDSGSPSREDFLNTAKEAVAAAKGVYEAAYGGSTNWEELAGAIAGFIYDTCKLIQRIAAGGDDCYEPWIVLRNEQVLLSDTSGTGTYNGPLRLFCGPFDHCHAHCDVIYRDPLSKRDPQWSVHWVVMRAYQ